jgi:hypothetical protein
VTGAPETIFDGAVLQARLWLPDRPTTALYVTFRQWVDDPGSFAEAGPVQRALVAGLAHLHIQSRWNDWFLNAETEALSDALKATRDRFLTARSLGFSMGGYAALRYSKALRLNQVLLISPQVSLHPTIAPWEDRYPQAQGFDPALGDLAAHARKDLTGVIVFDPFHPLDRPHARAIMALLPGLAAAPLGFGGHPGTLVLKGAGRFPQLQRLSFSAQLEARDIVRLHRAARATSPRYWRERAHGLLRAGRTALAAQALDQVEALTGD